MNFKDLLEAFDYNINGGSEYLWNCFPQARYATFVNEYAEITIVFSTVDQTIFEATVDLVQFSGPCKWDKEFVDSYRPYRWINPAFKDVFVEECKERGFDPANAWDDVDYIDLDESDDFIEKANSLYYGIKPDPRVSLTIDFTKDEIVAIALAAHELDITINQYINAAVSTACDEILNDL